MTEHIHRDKCGPLGKGTPGKRLKSAWRASGTKSSLREFVRKTAELDSGKLQADAKNWLASK